MSTFPIEEKITLKAWGDIINRPSYHSPVKSHKCFSVRVLAIYSFQEQTARCGVSDCLQAHNQGYLVLTNDEKEANLCEACGKRFFDATIKKVEKDLQEQARRREQQIQLNAVLQHSDQIKERINALKQAPYGANWLYRSLTNFQKAYPVELLVALREPVTSKEDNTVLSALVEDNADSTYLEQDEPLQGLGVFGSDIKETLIGKIYKPLKRLEEIVDTPDLNTSLTSFCQWAEGLEEWFFQAENLIEEGRLFFERKNMERLKNTPLSKKSARLLRSLRWDCENATVKGSRHQ